MNHIHTSSRCGPCVAIAPFFESLAAKYPTVTFFKVDVDEAEEISTKQNVNAMPTFQFFKGGNKVGELVGANKDQLEALIVQHSG